MYRLDADKPVHFCDGMTRRDFLHAGSLAFLGLSVGDLLSLKAFGAVNPDKDMNCIMLFLVGGPSQLDTWDMKPNAPAEIRGPYKPIPTTTVQPTLFAAAAIFSVLGPGTVSASGQASSRLAKQ